MHLARNSRGRRAWTHAALAGLLAIVIFALAQCTMVGEQLTGVQSLRRAPDCVRACKQAFKEARRAEKALHKENLKACRIEFDDHECEDAKDDAQDALQDPDREVGEARAADARLRPGGEGDVIEHRKDPECFRAEEERHRAVMKELRQTRKECVRGCHHQGSGSAG